MRGGPHLHAVGVAALSGHAAGADAVMNQIASPSGVGALPGGLLGRWLARVRACLGWMELDASLAAGADPWSSGPMLVRAQRLGTLAERQSIAAGLRALVELAEYRRPASPRLVVRHTAVLADREALLALAARLDHPQPVDIGVVAQLHLLVSDPLSPAYAGGGDPDRLAEITADCLDALATR